ncbi:MerR family transcriptional regulator [Paracoccus sp. Z118]|uniref:MerR family transcriptional regulator n=1 Tax=Paracoccus sp. Z118 TaxID=2851017 RepID=UPI001C2BB370|nr:MerR family transcriptional regulator [Paracoccus sp. Z118]MBV0890506.1 MerR family transcriptional regulator [Paracoccus sp. Z118]
MTKAPDAFRSIGEVAQMVGVAPHVLRYWEAQFPQLSPVKRADGRRYYRPDDVHLAAGLCEVLREEGLTIRGAKRLLSMDRGADLRARGERRLQAADGAEPTPVDGKATAAARPKPAPRARKADATPTAELPLFPDLAPDSAAATWLARLTRIAGQLRTRAEPLPPEAQALAARLRAAHPGMTRSAP